MKKYFLIYIIFAIFSAESVWGQVAIIVNKTVPADSISSAQVADIYRLKIRKWQNGNKIVPYNLKQRETIKSRFYDFIDENPLNMKKLWMRLQLTGEAIPPDALDTEEEVVQKVASTPGAIGFVSMEKVTDEVKVVALIE